MNNIYLSRKEQGKTPFTKEEVKKLISADFKIQELIETPEGLVTTLVVTSTKHPELTGLDPLSGGIGIVLDEEDGYWIDPRFFMEHDVFFTEVLPDLMTDLELDYDESLD